MAIKQHTNPGHTCAAGLSCLFTSSPNDPSCKEQSRNSRCNLQERKERAEETNLFTSIFGFLCLWLSLVLCFFPAGIMVKRLDREYRIWKAPNIDRQKGRRRHAIITNA